MRSARQRAERDRPVARRAQRDSLDQRAPRRCRAGSAASSGRTAAPPGASACRGSTRKNSAAPSAPPRPSQIRAATSADAGGEHQQDRLEDERGTAGRAKSNSAWKVESADQEARRRGAPAGRGPARARAAADRARERSSPSTSRTIAPSVESDAPPISIRWVGPQSVTSWPKSRCQMSSSGKPVSATRRQTAIIIPPSGAHQPPASCTAVGAGRLGRGSAIAEDARRRRRRRARRGSSSARGWRAGRGRGPLSMCSEMSQYMPNTAR